MLSSKNPEPGNVSGSFLDAGGKSSRLKTSRSDYLHPEGAMEKQIKLTASYIQLNQGRQRQFREAVPIESNAVPDGSVRVKPRQYKGKF
uniref:Uncharacterized protein n=1 Tax=Planktothricoides sp. SpSt-374 TaxID=2282167 RepID=A0A7C3VJV6_9CYAN